MSKDVDAVIQGPDFWTLHLAQTAVVQAMALTHPNPGALLKAYLQRLEAALAIVEDTPAVHAALRQFGDALLEYIPAG